MNIARLITCLKALRTDERGTTLVEFVVSLAAFLLVFFMIIDFGRLAFNYVVAEKGVQMAARIATVRPPACTGVPNTHLRHSSSPTPAPSFGTKCGTGTNICAVSTVTCVGDASNATALEVWGLVEPRLPNDATIANLRFTYQSDPALGFLGGPYVPVVTVELTNLNFQFLSAISGLLTLVGVTPGAELGTITFPALSVSLPGEDLAQGTAG